MISKENSGRAYGVVLAAIYATLITVTVHDVWPRLHIALALLFIGLFVGIYFTGLWMLVYRPAELDKKFPLSSKELRRRKKEFYAWLDSLGHR